MLDRLGYNHGMDFLKIAVDIAVNTTKEYWILIKTVMPSIITGGIAYAGFNKALVNTDKAKRLEFLHKERLDAYSFTMPILDSLSSDLFTIEYVLFVGENIFSFSESNKDLMKRLDSSLKLFIEIRYKHALLKRESQELLADLENKVRPCISYLHYVTLASGTHNLKEGVLDSTAELIKTALHAIISCRNQLHKDLDFPQYTPIPSVDNSRSYIKRHGSLP